MGLWDILKTGSRFIPVVGPYVNTGMDLMDNLWGNKGNGGTQLNPGWQINSNGNGLGSNTSGGGFNIGKIGNFLGKNKIETLLALNMLGGIKGSRQDSRIKELQRQLLEEDLNKERNLNTIRPMSTEVLRRLMAAGPYGKTPDFSDLYNYGTGR